MSSLVTFEIKSGGKALKSIQAYAIEVHLNSTGSSIALLRFLPHTTSGFPEMSAAELALDSQFEISLGYDDKNELVYSGKLTHQELSVSDVEGAEISIVCEEDGKESSGDSGLQLTYGENILEMDLSNNHEGVAGIIRTEGNFVLPGMTFELSGASALFDGKHEITRVVHEVSQGDWWTEIHIGSDLPSE